MENYVETGKVYVVNRDFPLPAHAYSRLAAEYANAAFRIGKFEKVEEALFTNQESWEKTGNVDGTVATVLTPAEMARVHQLLKSPEVDAAINRDVALGQTNRINQTPTMIITCKGQTYPVTGVVSFTILREFLDQLLSQK
jgi:protein-disulfide isomerase